MTDKDIRNEEIWALREKGETLKSIGKTYNLSLERIRQICDIPERRKRLAEWESLKGAQDT